MDFAIRIIVRVRANRGIERDCAGAAEYGIRVDHVYCWSSNSGTRTLMILERKFWSGDVFLSNTLGDTRSIYLVCMS